MSLITNKATNKKFETGYKEIEKEISEMKNNHLAKLKNLNSKKEEAEKRIAEIKKVMDNPDITLDEYTDAEIKLDAYTKYLDRINSEIRFFSDPERDNRVEPFRKLRDKALKLMCEENMEEFEYLSKYIISNLSDTSERQQHVCEELKDLCSFLSISTTSPVVWSTISYKGETVETEIDQANKMIESIERSRKINERK